MRRLSAYPPLLLLSALAVGLLGGCGEQEAVEQPGVRGPVTFRIWDRRARDRDLPPTVVRSDAVHQATAGFDDLEMVPVLIRRPLADGVVWVHSVKGRFQTTDQSAVGKVRKQQEVALQGPVHLTGRIRGLPITGYAETAAVPRGRDVLELTTVRLVRGGAVLTAPSAEVSEGLIRAAGPFAIAPGAPALTAVLGAVPE